MTTLLRIPHLRVLAKLALEHPDRPRPAHIVRHEDVHIDPGIFAGLDPGLATGAGEQFFRERHSLVSEKGAQDAPPPWRGQMESPLRPSKDPQTKCTKARHFILLKKW